jgi:hypothetical protein
VAHQRRGATDLPERYATGEVRKHVALRLAQTQQRGRCGHFTGGELITDSGLGVSKQPLGKIAKFRALTADGEEI